MFYFIVWIFTWLSIRCTKPNIPNFHKYECKILIPILLSMTSGKKDQIAMSGRTKCSPCIDIDLCWAVLPVLLCCHVEINYKSTTSTYVRLHTNVCATSINLSISFFLFHRKFLPWNLTLRKLLCMLIITNS